ncbi:hypothetical protein HYPSUDRAFT_204456 [Hypholoma sublateritium FD-334 SS-4]|uniref:Uncharacterized protein n=1 Tax=Hypholoma sublateritium (strain FD-334 SS-4) TaxID=945553 RepID=A0A0D2NL18_HYPSF|nr:hypothetical protein HYPSUDRAFT_204456 [Hypholoma sublateritium FD-334 SS-4]
MKAVTAFRADDASFGSARRASGRCWLGASARTVVDTTLEKKHWRHRGPIVVDAGLDRLNDSLSQFAQKRSDDTTGIHDFEYNCHY